MTIQLAPRKTNQGLLTIPQNTFNKVHRLKGDLDRAFIESNTKDKSYAYNLPYIDLYGYPIDVAQMVLITREEVLQYRVGIFAVHDKEIYLATDEINLPIQTPLFDKLKLQGYRLKLFLCSHYSLDKIVTSYDHLKFGQVASDAIVITQETVSTIENQVKDLTNLQEIVTKSNVSDSVQYILTAAVVNKASDIHFEPEKESYNIRLRLDGVLYTYAKLPVSIQKSLDSRLKILSGVKINIDNIPQDGRFSFKYLERDIDVRVSMLPSTYGYSIVMRLLGTGNVELLMADLGFDGINAQRVEAALAKPQGLILTTGPTGSGKTTTLYTFLSQVNNGENKIITLEDPIEYKLPGISQTQIDAAGGFTFASGLRSILRQDPDILMVGEIRDAETADIAVQASLTGHQVLSTIHTNDAAGSIPRMLEMGVKGFILADALEIVIGQRLVRKICPHCQQVEILDEVTAKLVKEQIAKMPKAIKATLPDKVEFYTSPGCEQCNHLGYKGRVGVYEVMSMTSGLKSLMSTKFPSIVEIRDMAMAEGMITMFQDGILKALKGHTDIKELTRNVSSY
ncbi:MAG: type II/IV secretion system protein [Candidatus Parcubacteria bacterium]|nr:type II/IV secretion system protein [Candidatus Paceibacterota bacterium]